MPTTKIKQPEPLPLRDLTEEKFGVWRTQLRAWLASDDLLAPFLPTGEYSEWDSEEANPMRIRQLAALDPDLQEGCYTSAEDSVVGEETQTAGSIYQSSSQLCFS